jgi:hypothetical protein
MPAKHHKSNPRTSRVYNTSASTAHELYMYKLQLVCAVCMRVRLSLARKALQETHGDEYAAIDYIRNLKNPRKLTKKTVKDHELLCCMQEGQDWMSQEEEEEEWISEDSLQAKVVCLSEYM